MLISDQQEEMKMFGLDSIFVTPIKSGDYHAAKKLDSGDIPLISSTEQDYGVIGYYSIPESKTYRNVVTIACNGQPLSSFFHPYKIAAKDDVLVCIPKPDIDLTLIYYTVAYLNSMKWRFCWARKFYQNKVKKLQVAFPVDRNGQIDREAVKQLVKVPSFSTILPQKQAQKVISPTQSYSTFRLDKLFHLERGDFHSLTKLEDGNVPTVSRVSTNNGVVGKYKKPSKAHIYPPGLLTVSTVAGDSFLQVENFICTDNVVILVPKIKMKLTTLYYIRTILNEMKWRYSYGRQCYKAKLAQTRISLPVSSSSVDGINLDVDFMEKVVTNSLYWNYLRNKIHFDTVSMQDFELKSGKTSKPDTRASKIPLEAFASS
jgi:hypothetical protein